jgi:hypothetical protein
MSNETPNFWKQEITALAVPETSNFVAWWDSMTYGSVLIWHLKGAMCNSNDTNVKTTQGFRNGTSVFVYGGK